MIDPRVKDLFSYLNVEDPNSILFKNHVLRVMHGLDMLINKLHDERVSNHIVQQICHEF